MCWFVYRRPSSFFFSPPPLSSLPLSLGFIHPTPSSIWRFFFPPSNWNLYSFSDFHYLKQKDTLSMQLGRNMKAKLCQVHLLKGCNHWLQQNSFDSVFVNLNELRARLPLDAHIKSVPHLKYHWPVSQSKMEQLLLPAEFPYQIQSTSFEKANILEPATFIFNYYFLPTSKNPFWTFEFCSENTSREAQPVSSH